MLQPLRSSIYAFKTDFVVASWIARLKPNELEAARAELASAGFSEPDHPQLRRYAAGYASLDKPVDVLMDVEPRNDQTMAFPGPFAGPAADPGADAGAGHGATESRSRPIRFR